MKILYGLYQPEEGRILLNGSPITINSPTDSLNHGIGMIHQHFMLVDNLTVAENVALGLPESKGLKLDLVKVSARINELTKSYGLNIDPQAVISDLAVGQRQRVEIIKALYRGAALLVLDEPTAVLTPKKSMSFLSFSSRWRPKGMPSSSSPIKLHEIFALTDQVTVLRDGRVSGTRPTAEVSKAELAEMMVGREVNFERDLGGTTVAEARLQLKDVTAHNDQGHPILKNVSLELHSGEIMGVAGVSGNGQKALAEAIAGLQPLQSGEITLDGKPSTTLSPSQRITNGLSYIPEERMHDGVVKDFSVAENLILRDHTQDPFSKRAMLLFKNIANHAQEQIKSFRVKTPSAETMIKNLSGGNIQKVVMARELARAPRVLIAAQPTRGVDIGAIEYIHSQLLEQRAAGLATLLISEDLEEIRSLSDRIAVMFDGEIMGIVNNADTTIAQLGLLMAGEKSAEPSVERVSDS